MTNRETLGVATRGVQRRGAVRSPPTTLQPIAKLSRNQRQLEDHKPGGPDFHHHSNKTLVDLLLTDKFLNAVGSLIMSISLWVLQLLIPPVSSTDRVMVMVSGLLTLWAIHQSVRLFAWVIRLWRSSK